MKQKNKLKNINQKWKEKDKKNQHKEKHKNNQKLQIMHLNYHKMKVLKINIFVKKIDSSDYINYIEVSKRDSEYNVYFYCDGKIIDLPKKWPF